MTQDKQEEYFDQEQQLYVFYGGIRDPFGEHDFMTELMPLQSEPLPSQLEKTANADN